MNTYIETSGRLTGFEYHDRNFITFQAEENRCLIEIGEAGAKRIQIVFDGVFSSSLLAFYPRSIVLSLFAWPVADAPEWFKENLFYKSYVQDGPIESRFAFFAESSFGATSAVFCDSIKVMEWNEKDQRFDELFHVG